MAQPARDFTEKLEMVKSLLTASTMSVAFTGAGVSTLSGIPDFRSSKGVYSSKWQGYDVEEVLSISFFRRRPDLFYRWGNEFMYQLEQSTPSIIHTLLAVLEEKGYLHGLFTQNIDMLHTKAGSKKCWEIHGSAKHHSCTNCNAHYPYEQIAPIVRKGEVPHCTKCQAVIRPDIVFYGESLDASVLTRAVEMFTASKLCIVLGSSLVVQPAASLPSYALSHGAKLVIVNAQSTTYDSVAAVRFTDLAEVGEALLPWAEGLRKRTALVPSP